MRTEIQELAEGWYQIYLRLRPEEIDSMIRTLQELKERGAHFHLMSPHNEDAGVADVEIALQGSGEMDNMFGGFSRS